jgi:hypothetical protein
VTNHTPLPGDIDLGHHTLTIEFRRNAGDSKYGWTAACHELGQVIERAGYRIRSSAKGPWTALGVLELRVDGTGLLTGPQVAITSRVVLRPYTIASQDFTHYVIPVDIVPELARRGIHLERASPRAVRGKKDAPPAVHVELTQT